MSPAAQALTLAFEVSGNATGQSVDWTGNDTPSAKNIAFEPRHISPHTRYGAGLWIRFVRAP